MAHVGKEVGFGFRRRQRPPPSLLEFQVPGLQDPLMPLAFTDVVKGPDHAPPGLLRIQEGARHLPPELGPVPAAAEALDPGQVLRGGIVDPPRNAGEAGPAAQDELQPLAFDLVGFVAEQGAPEGAGLQDDPFRGREEDAHRGVVQQRLEHAAGNLEGRDLLLELLLERLPHRLEALFKPAQFAPVRALQPEPQVPGGHSRDRGAQVLQDAIEPELQQDPGQADQPGAKAAQKCGRQGPGKAGSEGDQHAEGPR